MFEKFREWYNGKNKESVAEAASRLLKDDSFQIALERLQEGLLQQFISSRPEEKEKREDIYKKYTLSEELVSELSALFDSKNQEVDQHEPTD